MSLNKTNLKSALINLFTAEQDEETDANASVERLAQGIADAVDAFVKSGTVNVTVTTTGSATAQAGTGTGTIS